MSNGSNRNSPEMLKEVAVRKHSLAAALFDVRNRQATRDDVVVVMKEAELARLELLADEVYPYFDELSDDSGQFELALANGRPPRLWIDMTTHVSMGRDRRLYRFLKDTSVGRVILAESHERGEIATAIGHYMAERIIEKQRALAGDWTSLHMAEQTAIHVERSRRSIAIQSALFFIVGFATSALAIYAWYKSGSPPII